MVPCRLARLILLVTAALAPALASALDETGGGKPEPESRDQTLGSSLPHKSPQAVKAESKLGPTTASCINADTRCLFACPRTDESAELACSNRCRANLRTCKARIKKAPAPRGG